MYLGAYRLLNDSQAAGPLHMPPHHLRTHCVVVGMTGSGKTGLIIVTIEEALRNGLPILVIDVKGDLPNLLLTCPNLSADELLPWLISKEDEGKSPLEQASELAEQRRTALAGWQVGPAELQAYDQSIDIRVITPGSTAGELLHVLSSLERRSERWDSDPESARSALSAAISLLLRLLGRDPDPAKSREHVLLSVLAERRLLAGESADLDALIDDLAKPPIESIGALELNEFLPRTERKALSAALNTLLASPTFANWRQGATLDVGEWMAPKAGKTPLVILSVAHLDDDERALVLGVVFEEVLSWVRTLPGSEKLRSMVVFDEVYGFLPPHPANPPTKRPLVSLMKQARAFGVGVMIATQNPMDLDYRALGNAGVWCIGRLQTDADRARVVDGLGGDGQDGPSKPELTNIVKRLKPRWFLFRDVHAKESTLLMQPRYAMSFMRGPMTRVEIRRALAERRGVVAKEVGVDAKSGRAEAEGAESVAG